MGSGCAGPRHIAVVADQTFAAAVFALDDAAFQACETQVLSAPRCAEIKPVMIHAIQHVSAVTAAIAATKKDGRVPATLPDLLQDLADVRAILQPLAAVDSRLGELATKAGVATNRALALLKAFAGGN